MVAYFRAGRKASVVQLLDPGNVGERQRPAELQVRDVPLKRVDHDAAVGVVPEVEQSPRRSPSRLASVISTGRPQKNDRPTVCAGGSAAFSLTGRTDVMCLRPIRPYTPRPLAAY